MRIFTTLDDVREAAGTNIGTSEWITVDQAKIDKFSAATGSLPLAPEGIAPDFLTLSMLPAFNAQTYRFETSGARLNYGIAGVQFLSPVRAGARLRAQIRFSDVDDISAGTRITLEHLVEIDGAPKPAIHVRSLVLLVGAG
jgi:acyl dehydratase